MTKTNIIEIRRNHRAVVAKYTALAIENASKNKCMITFPSYDKTYEAINITRREFVNKMNSILKRKSNHGSKWAYFAVVEFGSDFRRYLNPHLHIQCYYDDIELIQEAFDYVINKLALNPDKCDLRQAYNNHANFDYIIKNYKPKNIYYALEDFKGTVYKGRPMYWSSHKTTPNYVIRRLYQELRELSIWKEYKNKYKLILDLIEQGLIIIKKINNTVTEGFKKIGEYSYAILESIKSPKTPPNKIDEETTIKKSTQTHEDKEKKDRSILTPKRTKKDIESMECLYLLIIFMGCLRRKVFKVVRWMIRCIRITILILLGRVKLKVHISE